MVMMISLLTIMTILLLMIMPPLLMMTKMMLLMMMMPALIIILQLLMMTMMALTTLEVRFSQVYGISSHTNWAPSYAWLQTKWVFGFSDFLQKYSSLRFYLVEILAEIDFGEVLSGPRLMNEILATKNVHGSCSRLALKQPRFTWSFVKISWYKHVLKY